MRYLLFGALFSVVALTAPISEDTQSPLDDVLGIKIDPGDLPLLTLPYGQWRANSYDKVNDVLIIL
jgi:hypothetical protein